MGKSHGRRLSRFFPAIKVSRFCSEMGDASIEVNGSEEKVTQQVPCAIVDKKVLAETRWLRLSSLTYTDPAGVSRVRPILP